MDAAAARKLLPSLVGAAAGVAVCLAAQHLFAMFSAPAEDDEPSTPTLRPTAPLNRQLTYTDGTHEATASTVNDAIAAYVEDWHSKNENAINMGEVELPIIGKVDLLPPHIERAIFTKMWTAVVSNLLETELTVAGVRIRMTALDVAPQPRKRDIGSYLRGRRRAANEARTR